MLKEIKNKLWPNPEEKIEKARRDVKSIASATKQLIEWHEDSAGEAIKNRIIKTTNAIGGGRLDSLDLPVQVSQDFHDKTTQEYVRIQPKQRGYPGSIHLVRETKIIREIENKEFLKNNLGLRIFDALAEVAKAQQVKPIGTSQQNPK